METLFWISFLLLLYTYVGYGALLFIYNRFFPRKEITDANFFPFVTLVVPAYNEEKIIRQKIENCLQLHYPKEKLRFVFITDGSSDNSVEIISEYPAIQVLHQPTRGGKSAAINRAMEGVISPVVVFTDANSLLHPQSIQKLVRHFINPNVGGVSGEKKIIDKTESAVGFGEKIYWQYESWLKKANANFYTIIGAAGELFAIRTGLFQPLDERVILDDFLISARVCQQGFRFLYEEEAVAAESSSITLAEERKRKIRISAGCFQALFSLKGLLNPLINFKVFFQYLSHRVLRWAVCPVMLPALLASNFYLAWQHTHSLYDAFLFGQLAFYCVALVGLLSKLTPLNKLLLIPSYFMFMILSQYAGFYRFIAKKQTVFWEKADRRP